MPLVALVPLVLTGLDWLRVSSLTADSEVEVSYARSFDWIVWEDRDGLIRAEYVFPSGPAAAAGVRVGDVFYMLDMQQYFDAETLQRAVEGIPPGDRVSYMLLRGGDHVRATVEVTRYPTFLYPLSPGLWRFSIWGFTVAAFFHLLGLVIVVPLALRGARARLSMLLILVSALWIVGNLARLVMIQLLGPPMPATMYSNVFRSVSLLGLGAWIAFPVFLVQAVLADTDLLRRAKTAVLTLLYLPAVILVISAVASMLAGHVGPLTPDRLIAPILFYACVYVGLAAVLVLLCFSPESRAEAATGSRSRLGNTIMLAVAVFAALSVLGIVPLVETVTNNEAGWFVVSAQLLSTVPVVLVSLATLRYGKMDRVVSRGLTYVSVLGLIFFAFVGLMGLLEPLLARYGWPRSVVAGVLVVLLLLVFERVAMRARSYFSQFFATDRERAARLIDRLQERIRDYVDLDDLLREAIHVVGRAFDVRSAVLFVQTDKEPETWHSASYHPEPPYLTERVVRSLWPHFRKEGSTWALNPELNLSGLPSEAALHLVDRGAVLAIPLKGRDEAVGLMVLGRKRDRRAVYNLEDVDRLRSLAGHLAIAFDRLELVEREKELVRESSEAQLKALRAQINPHFLFNALNTIAALIEERPDLAESTVENLAYLFRYILQAGHRPFVTLGEEMSLVESYLRIEQARFGDKLQVEIAVDPAHLDRPVPAFAIQTLVENAVKHGLETVRSGGTVRVASTTHGDDLVLEVTDDGVGIPSLHDNNGIGSDQESFFGLGLRNVSARLEYLFGRTDLLQMSSLPQQGTTARIRVPKTGPSVESVDESNT